MSAPSLDDLRKNRTNTFNALPSNTGKAPMYASYASNRHVSAPQSGHMLHHHTNPVPSYGQSESVSSLTEDFGRMGFPSLGSGTFSTSSKASTPVCGQSAEFLPMTMASGMNSMAPQNHHANGGVPLRQPYMYNGQVMFPSTYLPHPVGQAHGGMPTPAAMYAPMGQPYLVHNGYSPHHMVQNNSPLSQGWNSSRATSGEMPTLITPPRDSTSSGEDDAPGTPFTQYTGYGYRPAVAFMEQSPHSVFAWSTPSPSQQALIAAKAQVAPQNIEPELLRLIRQAPAIPIAVPSTTPLKSLDRCLENVHGITNVYVRGLQPDTTDEMLYNLASRFGEIASSKSIIDHATGLCKGYGFVKYHNYNDAMNCIRGFHAQGYETSFARESFYSQLKKLADETNTNLYVSNLPKDMNEHELGTIFAPHKVCSSRILRDTAGNGRGVGFARFESRDICEEVIKTFNNTPITTHGQEHLVQIRYADTQEQKSLKHQTVQARDWRSQEYELQTTGRSSSAASFNRVPASIHSADHDFEAYMTASAPGTKAASDYKYPHSAFGRFARERLHAVADHINPQTSPVSPDCSQMMINVKLPPAVPLELPEESPDNNETTQTNNCNVDASAYTAPVAIM